MYGPPAIAQALIHSPELLVIDEPTTGLDPGERVAFRNMLFDLGQQCIVLLSTHIVDDITSSCRRVAVLSHGTLLYEGDVDAIRRTSEGRIWDLVCPAEDLPPLPKRSILYRKHLGDRILYHYCGSHPLPGSTPVPANFEDAYVALLLAHERDAGEGPGLSPPAGPLVPGWVPI